MYKKRGRDVRWPVSLRKQGGSGVTSDMWILALINVSGIVSRFWVRVHEIGHIEIKAYKINHLSLSYLCSGWYCA